MQFAAGVYLHMLCVNDRNIKSCQVSDSVKKPEMMNHNSLYFVVIIYYSHHFNNQYD